ncbi:hypothetical protein NE237_032392 [Protea cynaroides]|uniref:Protein E6-like n=1 Tax=Protea cynaroides TaxID=273540 RepID=A0A9Q0R3H5_9MAGN|nr:hypothetical protein NE237_032392 [Protea cynaroides]
MASAKCLAFLFLLFIISSSLQIQARESKFFSKVTHDDNNDNTSDKETEVLPETEEPSRTQDKEPSFKSQNHNGFGLYGHGSDQFSPNSVNDAHYSPTNFPEKTTTEQKSFNTGYTTNNYNYNGYENKQQSMSDTRFMDTTDLNNNNNYYRYGTKQQGMRDTEVDLNNNNNYRYGTKQQGMRDTAADLNNNNYYRYGTKQQSMSDTTVDLNNNNHYYGYGTKQQDMRNTAYLNNNNNDGNEMKKQGMSDTRFLENGKYFYDVNNENVYHDRYHNQYEKPKETQNGYDSYRGVDHSRNRYNYRGYNGNNEFTNSMDGFQNQDQEFQESQEEYVP